MSAHHIPSKAGTHRPHEVREETIDGATLDPWKSGCLLVWDTTCLDTLAASYRVHATSIPGKVAAAAEERKSRKYQCLPPGHLFAPDSGSSWPKITSIPEGVGMQDQR